MTSCDGKNIVFIVPSLRSGGAERVMVLLANKMIKERNSVSFVFTMDETMMYYLDENIEIIINRGDRSPKGQIKFLNTLMKSRIGSTYVSFFTYQNIYLLIAGMLLPSIIIVSERNDPQKTTNGKKLMEFLRRIVYVRANKIVFQTQDAMNYFSKRIRRKGYIILNPLTPNDQDIYNGFRDKRIVAVARLNKQKNLPLMIKSVAEVLKRHKDFVFELYGESDPRVADMKGDLQKLVNDLGIGDRTHFKGFKTNVTDLIKSAAVYVNSSDFEGISNSMLEALSLGIPCVCTDCPVGGARMFIKNGINGYLVPVGDEEKFGQAIENVLSSDTILVSTKQEAFQLRRMLSIDEITDKWLKIM